MILEILTILAIRNDLLSREEETAILVDEIEISDAAIQDTPPVRIDEVYHYEATLERDLASTIPIVDDEEEEEDITYVEGDNDSSDIQETVSESDEEEELI